MQPQKRWPEEPVRLSQQQQQATPQAFMDRESLKAVLLCPTRPLTPRRKAIKHRTERTKVLEFKPCTESSDVEQDDAEQQGAERQHEGPEI